ncbi:protein kinase domain-containing protein [Candidatus Uabimicrobium amorphum]|uniref:non-specific serine/threonine protein kinase n=1 Tax=Uabimicrobium amorphum TaxID=2596890 RepID=A0A5S9ITQ2_UABAM|nr:serine/threonine-protein kinase [Candidatus Uabimicrobium amorphum]BBM87251.1 serine/threonine protein kinase [Candidatus Uabimicrobium amorphum]
MEHPKYNSEKTNSLAENSSADTLSSTTIFNEDLTKFSPVSPGKMFGKYKVEEEIGRGGMGIVYRAYDIQNKMQVALKLIVKQNISENDFRRFFREISAIAKLNHPNIIRFYESGMLPIPYFSMEYVEGYTLAELIRRRNVQAQWLLDVMIQICDGLAHAHKNQIMHRDIKPSNIIISRNAPPKIMDFGLAKLGTTTGKSLSQSGQILGTVCYMPPEQINGEATYESDIYSLGATMYEALTYRAVFQGETQMNLMFQVVNSYPIPPRQLNPDVSPYFEAVCLKCLAKKKHRRYKSFKQLAKELRNLKANKPLIAKKYTSLDAVKNFVRKHKAICASIASIVLILVMALLLTVRAFKRAEDKEQKLRQSNRELQSLNIAIAQFVKNIENSDYRVILTEKKIIKPLETAFTQSRYLKTAEDHKFLRAVILGQSKKLENIRQAVYDYSLEIKENPKDATIYHNRGRLYSTLKKHRLAMEDFGQAISLQPRNPRFYNNRGKEYTKLKELGRALADYKNAIFFAAKDTRLLAEIHNNRGSVFMEQKQYQKALHDYNVAASLRPGNPLYAKIFKNRGFVYRELGEYQKAMADYNAAIALPGISKDLAAGIYSSRGHLYRTQKIYDKAVEDYSTAISLNPKVINFYKSRGSIYRYQRLYKLAIQDLKKAVLLGDKGLQSKIEVLENKLKAHRENPEKK